jgi:dTDP-glucose 4,6-dehydratase
MNKLTGTILVTGGCGFIGSAVIRHLIGATDCTVVNIDVLTYAANPENVAGMVDSGRYHFEQTDIRDLTAMHAIFDKYRPSGVMHLAAESHVDRSIDDPLAFVTTNVDGTTVLLHAAKKHWDALAGTAKGYFRFLHVSTDEVYGSLGSTGLFTESTPYQPNSPYSASKAASDHFARAWFETYDFPVLITNCTNNYGPYHFPEKLIPLVILKGLAGEPLPVYGKGENVRDWLFVEDHAEALAVVLQKGEPGRQYNIGGKCEKTNLEVVLAICTLLDELAPLPDGKGHQGLIAYAKDRPGHDLRYAMDISRIEDELNWSPKRTFEQGLRETVTWYLGNRDWWQRILDGSYAGQRLGLG